MIAVRLSHLFPVMNCTNRVRRSTANRGHDGQKDVLLHVERPGVDLQAEECLIGHDARP